MEEKTNYLEEPLRRYIDRTFSKSPVPGGGSVVACVSALSCALIGMVLNYTLGKEKYAAYEEELKDIFTENEKILKKLSSYIEKDSEIYENIRKYTSLKDYINAERYLKESAKLHLDICKTVLKIIDFVEVLVERGNKGLISDTGIAASLAISTFVSAKINVLVNLKFIKEDSGFKKDVLEEIKKMEETVMEKGKAVYDRVIKQLEGKDG